MVRFLVEANDFDRQAMARALELARRGEGAVEPNPMVGCVIARDGRIVGEGWHAAFGGPHAEVAALTAAGEAAAGAAAYVTLEPCSHHGKTPPCTDALLAAGIARVVVATRDPNPQVAGSGVETLRDRGLAVEVGLEEDQAAELIEPFTKLTTQGRPWVIGKWAASLDGRIAARTGDSQWISGKESRRVAHQLRGRVDAVLVGLGTVLSDDPLLTARPPGPRTATRIVLDDRAETPTDGRLAATLGEAPVLVVCSDFAPTGRIAALRDAGLEVFVAVSAERRARLTNLLDELGRRRMTNLMVEGGAGALGAFHDANLLDEVHVFLAPKLVGGAAAPAPLGGQGVARIADSATLRRLVVVRLDDDVYISGRIRRGPA